MLRQRSFSLRFSPSFFLLCVSLTLSLSHNFTSVHVQPVCVVGTAGRLADTPARTSLTRMTVISKDRVLLSRSPSLSLCILTKPGLVSQPAGSISVSMEFWAGNERQGCRTLDEMSAIQVCVFLFYCSYACVCVYDALIRPGVCWIRRKCSCKRRGAVVTSQ